MAMVGSRDRMDFVPVLSCQLVCLRLAAFLEGFSTRKAKRDTNIPILPVSIRMCRRLDTWHQQSFEFRRPPKATCRFNFKMCALQSLSFALESRHFDSGKVWVLLEAQDHCLWKFFVSEL